MNDASTWQELLTWLSNDERVGAFTRYWDWLASDKEQRKRFEFVRRKLARQIKFRPESLDRLASDKRSVLLLPHFHVLPAQDSIDLFKLYFLNEESDLLCRFLNLAGIEHDEHGGIREKLPTPQQLDAAAVTAALLKDYSAERVFRYYATQLLLESNVWSQLRSAKDDLFAKLERPANDGADIQLTNEDTDNRIENLGTEEFTTLDRVLIEKIVETSAGDVGALQPEELEDLLHTVVALNSKRKRNFYHYGLMDTLVAHNDAEMSRPEINDERKAWYLAGALAANLRKKDHDTFLELLKKNNAIFRNAASTAGGPGAAMAHNLFDYLVASERITDAVLLVQGQLLEVGAALIEKLLGHVKQSVQGNDFATAQALVEAVLRHGLERDPHLEKEYLAELKRRQGQCLQRVGNFAGAVEIFESLRGHGNFAKDADLLADLGLVNGGFNALSDVCLPDGEDAQTNMREALARGRDWFEQALAIDPERAVNASYALGILSYLELSRTTSDTKRSEALQHLQRAVTGMRTSPSSDIYENFGILGQALFCQAVLNMEQLEADGANRAFSAWRSINEHAGEFPAADLKRLVEAAEAVDKKRAIQIAESIFDFRGGLSGEGIFGDFYTENSEKIRESRLEMARDGSLDSTSRWKYWSKLVPILIRCGRREDAEQGLDQMEELAQGDELAKCMVNWLETAENYDPVWEETDALWARVRLARQVGDDANCGASIHKIFYKIRDDQSDAAADLLDQASEWKLPLDVEALRNALPSIHVEEGNSDTADEYFAKGSTLSIVFVGGNEKQASYDQKVTEVITNKWPGVEIAFHHSGWSSNWGRILHDLTVECNRADVVVLMPYMRTTLGRRLRAAMEPPWVACTGTGRTAVTRSIERAARIAFEQTTLN